MLKWLRARTTGQPVEAPPPATPAETATAPDYLRREPVLNREREVCGYELNLERPQAQRSRHPSAQRFLDGALLDRIGSPEFAAVLGRRLGLLPLHPVSLDLPQLERLAAQAATSGQSLVIGLLGDAEGVAPEAVLERVKALKTAGLRLACTESLEGGPLAPLLPLADYLTIDVAALDPPSLLERQRDLLRRYPQARLIARNADTHETLEACRRLAFTLFQGRCITHRPAWREPRMDSNRMVVAQLIAQLRQDPEDLGQVALLARLDPVLAFRLLRYVNSAAMGLRHKIASLEHAMTYIGREGLYRWLTMLLFYAGKPQPMDEALRETALARARLTELLAQTRLPRPQAEMAFIAGLLSLADLLFQMPLPEVIGQLGLPEAVVAALLRREGIYGELLALAIACEEADQAGIAALADRLGLSPAQVSARHLEALVWAVELTDNLRSGL